MENKNKKNNNNNSSNSLVFGRWPQTKRAVALTGLDNISIAISKLLVIRMVIRLAIRIVYQVLLVVLFRGLQPEVPPFLPEVASDREGLTLAVEVQLVDVQARLDFNRIR